jgi:hypothetical protein
MQQMTVGPWDLNGKHMKNGLSMANDGERFNDD